MATCGRCERTFENALQLGAHTRVCAPSCDASSEDDDGDDEYIITEPVMYNLHELARRQPRPWGRVSEVQHGQRQQVPHQNVYARDYREVNKCPHSINKFLPCINNIIFNLSAAGSLEGLRTRGTQVLLA